MIQFKLAHRKRNPTQ